MSTQSQPSKGGFVKLATLISPEQDMKRNGVRGKNPGNRRRNGPSFSVMMNYGRNSDLYAGSANSPDATALPQPPKAWITDMNNDKIKTASSTNLNMDNDMINQIFSSFGKNGINDNNKDTIKGHKPGKRQTKNDKPTESVQKFFAQWNTGALVSITA
jgi:hypothetical protein